ncbi:MAG: hypothetical protein K8S87_00640 [Planctomycetes bacterium]|nr:hypothetical protein [Planctomycetota bacterium]
MIGECISVYVQYFFGYDVVFVQSDFEKIYIYPNVFLLIVLFFIIRFNKGINLRIFLPLQFFFYCIYYLSILIFAGERIFIGWILSCNERPIYHEGFRIFYSNDRMFIKGNVLISEAVDVWILFGVVFVLFVGTAMLYRYLKDYYNCKKQSAPFAIPEMSEEKSQE